MYIYIMNYKGYIYIYDHILCIDIWRTWGCGWDSKWLWLSTSNWSCTPSRGDVTSNPHSDADLDIFSWGSQQDTHTYKEHHLKWLLSVIECAWKWRFTFNTWQHDEPLDLGVMQLSDTASLEKITTSEM